MWESPHSPSGTGPVLETAHTTPLAARRSRAPPRRRPHAAPPRAGGLGHTDTPPRPTGALRAVGIAFSSCVDPQRGRGEHLFWIHTLSPPPDF